MHPIWALGAHKGWRNHVRADGPTDPIGPIDPWGPWAHRLMGRRESGHRLKDSGDNVVVDACAKDKIFGGVTGRSHRVSKIATTTSQFIAI